MWTAIHDANSGCDYYYHVETGEITWEKPRALMTEEEKNQAYLEAKFPWSEVYDSTAGSKGCAENARACDGNTPFGLETVDWADTVIVLCDGETAEGPTWVGSFIRVHNDLSRVRFHAVQLGGRSDGTLEALCEHTSGDYVEIKTDR